VSDGEFERVGLGPSFRPQGRVGSFDSACETERTRNGRLDLARLTTTQMR
jgi:hypothetical protein